MSAAPAALGDFHRDASCAQKPAERLPGLFRALFALALLAGMGLVAKGLYIPVKAGIAQILLDRAFERSVAAGEPVKPWRWADTAPLARIGVERLGVSEVVLSGGSGEAMAFGPTAILDDPARRIAVLAAHRDTHFAFVRDLASGDVITFDRIDGTSTRFRVTRLETVRWDEFSVPAGDGGGLLALATCYPFGSHRPGPLRRIAWAERIAASQS
ncbi:sortase domain-bontaining protein [Qipengyuania nanhaisediminis]|uniref:sortase domain-containing protein n=1 Tax=Qipengyuania nanhaisediminis TaxID=604088 RepID=UPI0038B2D3D1